MAENTRGRSRRTDSAAQNTIACETCRSKKRRCDRALPFCLQCAHDPSQCHYPEQNKRGLPLGYVNKLEARLAETEAALFHALRGRFGNPGSDPESLPSIYGGQNKTERIEEWDSLPLDTTTHLETWCQVKMRSIESARAASPSSSGASRQRNGRPDPRRQLPREQRSVMRQMEAVQLPREPFAAYSPPHAVFDTDTTVEPGTVEAEGSQARELSQAQSNMYF